MRHLNNIDSFVFCITLNRGTCLRKLLRLTISLTLMNLKRLNGGEKQEVLWDNEVEVFNKIRCPTVDLIAVRGKNLTNFPLRT